MPLPAVIAAGARVARVVHRGVRLYNRIAKINRVVKKINKPKRNLDTKQDLVNDDFSPQPVSSKNQQKKNVTFNEMDQASISRKVQI